MALNVIKNGVQRFVFLPLYVSSVSQKCPVVWQWHTVVRQWWTIVWCGSECGGKDLTGGPCLGCDISIGFDRFYSMGPLQYDEFSSLFWPSSYDIVINLQTSGREDRLHLIAWSGGKLNI